LSNLFGISNNELREVSRVQGESDRPSFSFSLEARYRIDEEGREVKGVLDGYRFAWLKPREVLNMYGNLSMTGGNDGMID